ncbi:MAG: DEAD/DEAH box helicase [Bacilli bacterium]|nr:DEAD/DEAH box helicase [Bacilli bacterium]
MENYKKGIDSLVYAVCGSGKTEISLKIIQYVINCGEKIAFAIPRKDVCIELYSRLKDIFSKNKVIALYGGHTKEKYGDIVVLTTHQLFRFKKYFSLIILDEIDAFPFSGDPVLNSIFYNALNGHYIMMSATPSEEVINHFSEENKDILKLQTRFHRHPLPVPELVIGNTLFLFAILIKKMSSYLKEKKPIFVFAPTIKECEKLFSFLSIFFRSGNYVHSKRKNRGEIIDAFRSSVYSFLVTTSVLERGVTVKNLQVIIFKSDSFVYEKGVLVQIAGRVGRKADAPEGEVIFLANKKTKEMELAVSSIQRDNKALQDMLQRD